MTLLLRLGPVNMKEFSHPVREGRGEKPCSWATFVTYKP
jgi:hypothetical protein